MNTYHFSRQDLARLVRLSVEDLEQVWTHRYQHTRLGFACHLGFVRLYNRLPLQELLEIVGQLLTYVSEQVDIPDSTIDPYLEQPRTIITHQQAICDYLGLRRFGAAEVALLEVLWDECTISCFCFRAGHSLRSAEHIMLHDWWR